MDNNIYNDTRGANCPICRQSAKTKLIDLAFSNKSHLPENISLVLCADCDFVFSTPGNQTEYNKYYAAVTNDQIGLFDNLSHLDTQRYDGQLKVLSSLLNKSKSLNVLDIGCGRAGLIHTLKNEFPHNKYYGSDPNICDSLTNGVVFSSEWRSLNVKFDLIIFSHAIEHLIDLTELADISNFLTDNGSIYIEVPDASRYNTYARREFLYQIDRLHVNHFSAYSLSKFCQSIGLTISDTNTIDFEYKDGNLYPSFFVVAGLSKINKTLIDNLPKQLDVSFKEYLNAEYAKASTWKRPYIGKRIVVYGFGDNFFRASTKNGPLEGLKIEAIIDRNFAALRNSKHSDSYHFVDLDAAIKNFPELDFIITLSWGGESVAAQLKDAGIRNISFL